MKALGQALAMAWARVAQIPALTFCHSVKSKQVTYEEIISSHAWLSWDTSRDDDNIAILEGFLGTVVSWKEASDLSRSSNVRKIGRNLISERLQV